MRSPHFVATLLVMCFCTAVSAKEYRVNDVPMVHLADRTRYVSNPDNILSAEAVAAMDNTLFSLERKTGIQVVVVALEQIEGGDCFDFAYRLGQENGVGQKGKDNGLVILLVTGERCVQFSTGYGIEGVLPDAICKKIQVRHMNKAFAQGDWDAGMLAGIEALRGYLDGESGTPDRPSTGSGEDSAMLFIALFCVIGFTVFYLWLNVRRQRSCPKCHKHTMKVISRRTISKYPAYHIEEIVSCCSNCGHYVRKEQRIDDENNNHHGRRSGPFAGGIFMGGFGRGGFGRGGFGGGGFGGGSFGGGSFGGGGAGSRF